MTTVDEIWGAIEESKARHCTLWTDEASGLRALLVLDDLTLGPAVGGVRTQPYPSTTDALADACYLARAMTLKCALAGLDAGGGKIVVLERADLDRPRAFEELGARVDDLGGRFLAGSDLGTRKSDLEAMGRRTRHVHVDVAGACDAVAEGVCRSIEACAAVRGRPGLGDLKVAVQGCGAVGAAVARKLAAAGAKVVLADVDRTRAEALADEVGGEVCAPAEILLVDVDVVSPCAVGGVITERRANAMKAWGIAGGANNVLASFRVGEVLRDKGVLFVPDIVSSAGGVVAGVGGDASRISALGTLSQEVLEEARTTGKTPYEVAVGRAKSRIAHAALQRN